MQEVAIKTREFMRENEIDYLLVNSTNEFLVEYNDLDKNSRYYLTDFSGSTGDAVISQKDIFLFVDGRYHEQADLEVDKSLVTVVKMKLGESFNPLIVSKISKNKTFAIVSTKVSEGRLEILRGLLAEKNVKLKILNEDFISKIKPPKAKSKSDVTKISEEFTGLDSDKKIKDIASTLKPTEAFMITNLEELSYLFNIRDFSKNYSTKVEREPEIILSTGEHFKFTKENFRLIKEIKRIYVDKNSINAYYYDLLWGKACGMKQNPLKDMKSVKTDAEISHYKKCFERTDKALTATREFIKNTDNISEYDIDKNLEDNFYKYGAKSLSFKTIVAKDKNSALAHYSRNSKSEILKDGSLILIDCGAYYEGGYATDCTRVFVKGNPTELQKEVYTVVLKGFLKAFRKKITKNTTGFNIDKDARKILNELKPEGFEFSHSLGHGIGISVHENPPTLAFSPLAKTPLKPNMCFTNEPGLYNPKYFGVRIENSCYMSKDLRITSFSDMCLERNLINFDMLNSAEKKQLKNFDLR